MNIKDVIKLGLWLLLVFALSATCYAETIQGSVKDVNGHPMPFVTISVLDKDSTLLTGDITDEQGKYEIEISNVKSQISNFLIQASLSAIRPFSADRILCCAKRLNVLRKWK